MNREILTINDEISKLEKLKMDILKERKEADYMKIAVSSSGRDMDSGIDSRFGRCPYFILLEIEGKEVRSSRSIENTSANQVGSAGMSAAQLIADSGAKAVITVNIGPRALSVFRQLGIEVYQAEEGKVSKAVDDFKKGRLKRIRGSAPNRSMPRGGSGNGLGRGRTGGMDDGRRMQ